MLKVTQLALSTELESGCRSSVQRNAFSTTLLLHGAYLNSSLLHVPFYWRRQWHPTPATLPGKPVDGGAWWAAVNGVAKSRTRLSDFTFTFHFHALETKWQPTPVFLPGESQGRGSLVDCHPWGRTESDTTEAT